MPFVNRHNNVTSEKILDRKLWELVYRDTKKVVQLEHFIVLNVTTSQHVRKLI